MAMFRYILVLVGWSALLSAQIQSPQLRCLSVQQNGDVVLNWLPPADPSNVFVAYEIYYSSTINGTFSLVSGTVTPLSTAAYTVVGGSQGYYFVRIKETGGYSLASDTLRTIFLNILAQSGSPDLKLVYNDNHKPRLLTSATSYTLVKEYPIGTFNALAVTPLNQFSDTIAVCSASINYQVFLADKSGCVSSSNRQGGLYSDQKQPNKPYIDSISVLPNGQVAVAWQRPSDPDLKEYEIQLGTSLQGGTPLDTVHKASTTFYIYTGTLAAQNAVVLGPKAIDSCGNGSEVDYSARTMYLKTTYDKCAYGTALEWTPYSLRPGFIDHYEIYYSVSGGNFRKLGSTTLTTYYHASADPAKQLTYFIRMVSRNKGPTASSNRVTFLSVQVESADFVYLAAAGYVSGSEIQLQIVTDTAHRSAGAEVLRSMDGSHYSSIGFVPILKSQREYVYSDQAIFGNDGPYFYKLIIRDSCNNARAVSNVCKTIRLKIEADADNFFIQKLSWTAYEGFESGVKNYYVYRIVNGEFDGTPIAILKDFELSYRDNVEAVAPLGSSVSYQVQAIESAFNLYKIRGKASSNEVRVYNEAAIYVPNAFAPMGVNQTWKPVTQFVNNDDYKVRVFDKWGHVVFETSDKDGAWDGANCEGGVYAYQIVYLNARGEYAELRGSVLLLR